MGPRIEKGIFYLYNIQILCKYDLESCTLHTYLVFRHSYKLKCNKIAVNEVGSYHDSDLCYVDFLEVSLRSMHVFIVMMAFLPEYSISISESLFICVSISCFLFSFFPREDRNISALFQGISTT
jgi:hypothetical protein